MKEFESLLFQSTDDKVVLNRTILASDLSVLTVNKWLNLSIIQGFLDIANEQSTDTKAFILNSLIGLKGDLPEELKKCAKKTVRFFTFVICVGGNISETFLGTLYHLGVHWSLLYVDTVTNEWFYCDSLGWAPPKELKNLVDKVISAFSNLIQLPIRPVQGRFIAHMSSNTSHGVHGCSALCLRNIPLQECGNICGVVTIILAAISCIDKPLWSNSFLKRNACPLPDNISWLRHPTTNASYLRRVLIYWLMAKHIDLRLIGITTPAIAAAAPVCPHGLDGLEGLKSKYEDDNFCELWKKDVRTLAAAQKRVPKRIAIANPALYYYSLLLSCKFGGEPKKRNIRVRKTKSSRQGCPFEVYLALALDGQALEVTRITEGHNHQLSKELYDHLPRQRAFECKLGVLHAIKLRANTKLLQQNVLQTTGKRVTLKDLRI